MRAGEGAEMSTDERAEFEKWAQEVYGGDASRYFVRVPQYPDEYLFSDVYCAWKAWEYRAKKEQS